MDATRRLLWIGLALAAAVAALAWIASPDRDARRAAGEDAAARAPASAASSERSAERDQPAAREAAALAPARTGDARAAVLAPQADALAAGALDPAGALPGADLPEAAWRGRVRERESEHGVEGARVVLTHGERVAQVDTDAEGAFELAWPEGLEAELAILHPRYADLRVAGADLARDGLFRLERSARIAGRVEPWPAPGAEPGVAARALLWPRDPRAREEAGPREAALEPDGAFAFLDVPAGAWNVAVHAPGALVGERGGIELAPGERRELVLRARSGATLAGRVLVEGARTPVSAAQIEASALRRALPDGEEQAFERVAESGADGAFELTGLAPGPTRLVVRLPWGAEARREVVVPESLATEPLELLVPGSSRVAGRVVDAGGAPVAGARVVLLPRGKRDALEDALSDSGAAGEAARTDASGAFAIDAAPAETALCALALPEDAGALAGSAEVGPIEAGAAQLDVLVRLPRGAPLEGRALGSDGLPAPGAIVSLRAVHQQAAAEIATVAADAEGFFRFDAAPAGVVVLTAEAEGYLPGRARVELDERGARDVALELVPASTVGGVVRDPDGAGVAGLAVMLEIEPGSAEARALIADGRGVRRLDVTDAYGRIEVGALARGRWTARLWSGEWEIERSEPPVLDVPRDLALELVVRRVERPPLAAVRGEAWTADGEPLAGLYVRGIGREAVVTTDGERFEARGIEPGERSIVVGARGYVPARLEPLALDPGAEHDLGRIDLERGTRLSVRVVGADGDPLRGARVVLRPIPREKGGAGGRGWRLRERGAGVYRAEAVPRGRWRLSVTRSGFRGHDEVLEVRKKSSQEARVELRSR